MSCYAYSSNMLVTLTTEEDSVAGARHVSGELRIKFDGDSIIFTDSKGSRSYSRNGVKSIMHAHSVLSPLRVNVYANVEENPAVEGARIEVTSAFAEEETSFSATTDSQGSVILDNLPSGDYTLSVAPPDGNLLSSDTLLVTHDFDNVISVGMEENLISPYDITIEYTPLHTGLTEVELSWKTGNELLPYPTYLYFIELEGNYYDETESLSYRLAGLPPGTYTAELFAQSGFGTLTQRIPVSLEIEEVDPDIFAGVEGILLEEDPQWRYFTLDGVEVDPSHLASGLYIRTNGLKHEKILKK